MGASIKGNGARAFLLLGILLVAGCKEVVYSGLSEVEANEMVAILEASGISSGRERDKDGVYSLLVEGADVAPAITILKTEGYPRKKFRSMGDIFSAEGIVGTPFEERARFIYALNEELSRTISTISGVRSARVHIMLPATSRFDRDAKSSRASVTIHFEEEFAAQQFVPTIKTLVAHSVPNLEYENVAVALFPVGGASVVRIERPLPGNAANAATIDGSGLLPSIPAGIFGPSANTLLLGLAVLLLPLTVFRSLRRRLGGR